MRILAKAHISFSMDNHNFRYAIFHPPEIDPDEMQYHVNAWLRSTNDYSNTSLVQYLRYEFDTGEIFTKAEARKMDKNR